VATFSRSGSAELATLAAEHPERLVTATFDAADSSAVQAFVRRVVERFGGVTHCIANAAVAYEGVLAMMRDDEIDQMLGVNLRGPILLAREAVRAMLAGDGPAPGDRSVVLVSSVVATHGSPGLSVYAATKAGHEGFARNLARELGPRGIRVNAIAPGFLETDLSASLPEEHRRRIERRTPLGRLGKPADIVGAIDFLTSPRAAFITGQVLPIDGGA
jgi:3-oxoacyl-[acyl-carrier protein] reductase